MEKVTVTCKLITPLFMYGAENNFEIRASSIKGLLRYWWRTYNSVDVNHSDLLKKENEIFGSKEKKSPVSIKINTEKLNIDTTENSEIEKADYLFYSLKLGNGGEGFKSYKQPEENESFDIEFRYKDRENLDEYIKALKIMQLLGGIGSRSRRGAGNFKITDVKVKDDDNDNEIKQSLIFNPTTDNFESEFKQKLNTFVNNKINKIGEYPNIVGSGFSIYTFSDKNDNNDNQEKDIIKIQTFDSWKGALSKINGTYKNFRKNIKKLQNNQFGNEATAVFGLPLFYGEKSSNKYEFTVQKREHDKEESLSRLPSPIIFKIHKTSEGKYIALIIKLSGNMLDNYSKVYEKKGNETNKELKLRNEEDENLIDIFLKNDKFIKLY